MFWTVELGLGVVTLKLPEGLHPEEVEADLMTLYGEAGRLAYPLQEEDSLGSPRQRTYESLSGLDALQYHDFTEGDGLGAPVLKYINGTPSTGNQAEAFRNAVRPR